MRKGVALVRSVTLWLWSGLCLLFLQTRTLSLTGSSKPGFGQGCASFFWQTCLTDASVVRESDLDQIHSRLRNAGPEDEENRSFQ